MIGPVASRRRLLAAGASLVLLAGACDVSDAPADDPADDAPADDSADDATDEPEDGAAPAEDGDAGEGDAPPLPEVTTVDPGDVDPDAEPGTLDGTVASASGALPDGWEVAVVPDPTLGPYVVGLPAGATIWRVGDDLGALGEATDASAWWRYWEPTLREASEAVDSSSLRAAVALPGDDPDARLHLTITATPRQDLPADDPAATAERFEDAFTEQGLTVVDVGTATAGDDEVAALTLTTPEDEFEDGVPRRLVQWFYPETESEVLWSVTCEGPATDPDHVDEVCAPVLASFRTPPR